jgi:selenide, water dikinase
VLHELNIPRDENVIVGTETNDDAGVYRLSEDMALVQTADYITPVVDDPFLFGQVAAANSLSDVYAMGGRPLTVLNLCNFPPEGLENKHFLEILKGGLSKTVEAGATLLGGHTVKDPELKYGLSVTGVIDPRKVVRNATPRVGDRLVLTKKIGSGVLITGFKQKRIGFDVRERAVQVMATLNKVACETMMAFDPHACTDITGFGLTGHTLWMVKGANVGITLYVDRVPHFPESIEMIKQGVRTGVTLENKALVADFIRLDAGVTPEEEMLVYDPQTSGGLFIAVAADQADALVQKLRERGVSDATVVGEVFQSPEPVIRIAHSR